MCVCPIEATATWSSLYDAMNALSLDGQWTVSFWQVAAHNRAIPVFVPGFVVLKRLEEVGAAAPFWPAPRRRVHCRPRRGHGVREGLRGRGGGVLGSIARGPGDRVCGGGGGADALHDAHAAHRGDEDVGAIDALEDEAEAVSEEGDHLFESDDEAPRRPV